jgi:anti-sigma-K factor RskA
VERDDIHDLTAPYALDALDGAETEAFEKHLRHCDECRAEVALLRGTASLLAHDAPPMTPPPELRERILASARAERGNVIPFRQRFAAPIAAVAAVAACAALALGLWAATLKGTVGDREAALRDQARALAVIATPGTRRIPLSGGHGTLVVAPDGRAALVLTGLARPASGKVFEAWVVTGKNAAPAGVFSPGTNATAVELDRAVPSGATVALTIEKAGGAPQPTGAPILQSRTAA